MDSVQVLLVKDEHLIRFAIAEVLRDEGLEVVEAENGVQAVGLIDGPDGFDVLFTDVRMPGTLDGLDVAVHCRQQHPVIPLLVVSGGAADLASRLSRLEPPALFIGKPYQPREVVTALNGLTKGRKAPAVPDD